MAEHERFRFKSLPELQDKISALGVAIRLQEDLSPLSQPVRVGAWETPNSLAIHPMEGCDGLPDGAPGELTVRRYERFARGGAGLLWFEATAVVPEGRANPRQLWLHEANAAQFAGMRERAQSIWREEFGERHRPVSVLQLTHSGRYSKPTPLLPSHNPAVDARQRLPEDYPLIADDQLQALEDRYVAAARLAWQSGFQAVDVKSCHGYLVAELLAAHTRPGRYGGDFEGRTRFLLNVVDKIRQTVPELLLAVRLNVCDGLTYPYAWGMDEHFAGKEDLTEPIRLAHLLYDKGVRLLNVTAGNPYYNPHLTRPYDQQVKGVPVHLEHPLEGVARLFRLAAAVQQAVPGMVVMGAGYSWLRQFFPQAAAASLADGRVRLVGLGREAFAYPDFARDLLQKGALDPRKLCTACSKCTQLMRDDGMTGCVTRDAAVYLPIYQRCHGR